MKQFLCRRIEERKELLFRSNFLFLPVAVGMFLLPYLAFFFMLISDDIPPIYGVMIYFSFFEGPFNILFLTATQNLFVIFGPQKLLNKTKLMFTGGFILAFLYISSVKDIEYRISYYLTFHFWPTVKVLFLIFIISFGVIKVIKKIFFSGKRIQGSIEFGKLWYLIIISLFIYAVLCFLIFLGYRYNDIFNTILITILIASIAFSSALMAGAFIWVVIFTFRAKGFIRRKIRPLIDCVNNDLIYSVTVLEIVFLLAFGYGFLKMFIWIFDAMKDSL